MEKNRIAKKQNIFYNKKGRKKLGKGEIKNEIS